MMVRAMALAVYMLITGVNVLEWARVSRCRPGLASAIDPCELIEGASRCRCQPALARLDHPQ
jgi:hypothetical protein